MTPIFHNALKQPDTAAFAHVLGDSFLFWEEIRSALSHEYGPLTDVWKFYGARSGWTLKLMLKKRNLFFVSPREGYFMIAFVFGDKAVTAIEKSSLPNSMKQELANAQQYSEGRGLRIDVKKKSTIKHILTLASFKMKN